MKLSVMISVILKMIENKALSASALLADVTQWDILTDDKTGAIVLSSGVTLTGLALHRFVPGKRYVFSCDWEAQSVFVKIFTGKDAEKYAERDARGTAWLTQAGLRTPALLWRGGLRDKVAAVLVYAAAPAARNVEALYAEKNSVQSVHVMQQLTTMLAQMHNAGLMQTDLHLKNFLWAADAIWAIDGDGVRQKVLNQDQALRQLAQLIAKLHVLDQHAWIERLLETYLAQRGWSQGVDVGSLLLRAKKEKVHEVDAYVHHKIFRNCTDVVWHDGNHYVSGRHAAAGIPAIDPSLLESAMHAGQVIKPGNSCTVVAAQLQHHFVVIKRYNLKNVWHALSRCWRPSRAAASWSNAHRLHYYGISTPQPLLMLEVHFWRLRGKAYFVTEYSPWPDALVFFKQTTDKRLRAEAVKQLSLLCYQLYLLRLSHGDMKATNLQITDSGQVVVMDLDSMRQHYCAQTAMRAHVKDLHRLLQNWKDDTSLYNALVKSLRVVYVDAKPLTLAGLSI